MSNTRKELAAKLSSGENTVNCSMALLQLNVHENTIVELSRVAFLLAPLLLLVTVYHIFSVSCDSYL